MSVRSPGQLKGPSSGCQASDDWARMPSTPRTRKRQQQARRAKQKESVKTKLRRENSAARKQARLKLEADKRRDIRQKDRAARRLAKLEVNEEEKEQLQQKMRKRAYRKELEEDWWDASGAQERAMEVEGSWQRQMDAARDAGLFDFRSDEQKAKEAAAMEEKRARHEARLAQKKAEEEAALALSGEAPLPRALSPLSPSLRPPSRSQARRRALANGGGAASSSTASQ